MTRITFFGSEQAIVEAIAVLKKHKNLESVKESEARLMIQELIDKHGLKASILVNGSWVWSKERILANLDQIIKHGILYNEDQTKPPVLSHYFYQFLTLECGSINHSDIQGWVHTYPTLEHLKKFFKQNEFGKRVLEWIPKEHADSRTIVQSIEIRLFPFQSYLNQKWWKNAGAKKK